MKHHHIVESFRPAEEKLFAEIFSSKNIHRRLVKVLPRTAKWSDSDLRLLARHFLASPPNACRQSAGADFDFVVVFAESAAAEVVGSSGEEGGVGKAGKSAPLPPNGATKTGSPPLPSGATKTGLPPAVGELGKEETERTGEQGLAAGTEEEDEVEASESVKELLIPSMEWNERLKSREPTAHKKIGDDQI